MYFDTYYGYTGASRTVTIPLISNKHEKVDSILQILLKQHSV
jgi:hypothetical protein